MAQQPDSDDRAAPGGPLCRVAFGLSYDGSRFHGFAIQPDTETVAGAFLGALERTAGAELTYTCAGRTDAGVHALAQVVHVDIDRSILVRRYAPEDICVGTEIPDLARALSRQLLPSIVVWRAVVVDPSFDARRSATARRYRYDLRVGERIDPLLGRSSWWVGPGLDLDAMRLGCDPLVGSHDFAGFCRRPPGHTGPIIRRVNEATFRELDDRVWRFEIESSSFCHQMVRAIVGSLKAIGEGKLRASDITARLRGADRTGSPPLAPPGGLTLIEVSYPDELGGSWR
ncbi:MAG TPA: tRNA pseudouridine(38-40) synthase TruA [Acidimicrobiales bacterium]|nr:tRNA pseudouridine(38-40) synthase TruA [Acidimicrobiales bacterium]